MILYDWFECEDDALDENARRFLTTLRQRARSWPVEPANTRAYEPNKWLPTHGYLDIVDAARGVAALTVGFHLEGDRLTLDEVHNQDFSLPKVPTSLARRAAGAPEDLANIAANWFEAILNRAAVHGPTFVRGWQPESNGQE